MKPEPIINFVEWILESPEVTKVKKQIAKGLGVSPSYLDKIFRGDRPWRPIHLEKIRKDLIKQGMDPDDFDFSVCPREFRENSRGQNPYKLTPQEFIHSIGWSVRKLADKTRFSLSKIQRVLAGRDPLKNWDDFDVIRDCAQIIGCKCADFNWLDPMQQALARRIDEVLLQPAPTQADIDRIVKEIKRMFPNPQGDTAPVT